jgi:acetolactate synthase-1/2/3 large subunit
MISVEGQVVGDVPEMLPAAEALLDVLRLNGVRTIFASPGSEMPPLWDALARPPRDGERPLRYLNTRQELLTTGMAVGYHKATGELPAVFLHSSAGPLQGALCIGTSSRDQTPMVVFSGDSVTWGEDPRLDPGNQWLRSLAERGTAARLMTPLVRWADVVTSQTALLGMVEHACRVALAPPRGPTFLSIPLERMMWPVQGRLIPRAPVPRPRVMPDPDELDRAADILAAARNPLIITEEAGRDPTNVARLVELAELMGAPVVEAQTKGYMNFPGSHPLHLGYSARSFLTDADAVFLCGARGPWHPASASPADPAAPIILADENAEKSHLPLWNYRVDVYAYGALSATLDGLLARLRERRLDDDAIAARRARWAERHAAQRAEWAAAAQAVQDASPIHPHWAAYAIGEALPREVNIVEETTSQRAFVVRHLPHETPGRYFARMGGGLGVSIPYACGIKVARPDEVVVSVLGDGGFNYNPVAAALGFQLEYQAPILTVIVNNQSYASMKGGTEKFYPDGWSAQTGVYHGASIAPAPDYAEFARAAGGHGEVVTDPREVGPAVRRGVDAVRAGQPAIVDVRVAATSGRE